MVEYLHLHIQRVQAATSAGVPYAGLYFKPSGGSAERFMVCSLTKGQNSIDDMRDMFVGTSFIMLPGDQLTAVTYDGSTGGSCQYLIAAKITEFDA